MAEEASEKVSGVYERGVPPSKGLTGTELMLLRRSGVSETSSALAANLTLRLLDVSESLEAVRVKSEGLNKLLFMTTTVAIKTVGKKESLCFCFSETNRVASIVRLDR